MKARLTIGSPPPMRGKVVSVRRFISDIRITPAYAGKSVQKPCGADSTPDHPRLCGEKIPESICFIMLSGSPPPMRGKAKTDLFDFFEIRITPAYAGKSSHTRRCPSIDWDHPRLCGEKSLWLMLHIKHMGSPPPMRGKAPDL